eukprot:1923023-Rhodomonas_salina.1
MWAHHDRSYAVFMRPGSPGAPAHPPYACCDACDATYGFMHAKPSLSRTRTGAGRSTSAMARVESDSRSGDTRQEAIRLSVSRLQAGRTRTRTRRPEGGGVHVNKDDVRVGRRATQEGEGRAMVLYCGREYAFNRAALHPTTPQVTIPRMRNVKFSLRLPHAILNRTHFPWPHGVSSRLVWPATLRAESVSCVGVHT